MGKAFRILGAILMAAGAIGILGLVFNIGVNPQNITTWGMVESTFLLGLIFQILYMVTEMQL
ncbi:hypothetical protein H8E50_12145 [bacterium]|nr:hypothetical protein [bacterium]